MPWTLKRMITRIHALYAPHQKINNEVAISDRLKNPFKLAQ